MTESLRLAYSLVDQKIDVVEQELSSFGAGDRARRTTGCEISRLSQNPGIPAGRHDRRARPDTADSQALDYLFRLDAVAAAEHGNREPVRDLFHEFPVGATANNFVRRSGRARPRPRRPRAPRGAPASGALRSASFQPARILTVTGICTAFAMASMTLAAWSGSRIRLQPALCLAILGTGQPMFTSTISAPMPSTMRAASAIFGGIAAEDLNRDRALFVGELGVLERPIDATDQPLGADHLADDEPASALTLDEPAKRRVGHAGHGRDNKGRRQVDGSDLHRYERDVIGSVCPDVSRVDFDGHAPGR